MGTTKEGLGGGQGPPHPLLQRVLFPRSPPGQVEGGESSGYPQTGQA
jgi:hypothetical protein